MPRNLEQLIIAIQKKKQNAYNRLERKKKWIKVCRFDLEKLGMLNHKTLTTLKINMLTPGMILWHLWTGAIAELIPLLGFEMC
jgi:hypothetical protein